MWLWLFEWECEWPFVDGVEPEPDVDDELPEVDDELPEVDDELSEPDDELEESDDEVGDVLVEELLPRLSVL